MGDVHERVAERLRSKAQEDKLLIETFIQVEILDAAHTLAEALTKAEPVDTEVIQFLKPDSQRHFWKEAFGKSSSTEPRLRWLCVSDAAFDSVRGNRRAFAHTVALLEGGVIEDHSLGYTSLYGDGQLSKPSSGDDIVTVYTALGMLNKRYHLRETRNLFKKIPGPVMDVLKSGNYPPSN